MSLTQHLPALPVLLPLVASPIAVMLPKGTLPWLWATAIAWVSFACALALLIAVIPVGSLGYDMGGWAAPLGIAYHVDVAGALVMTLVAGMAAVVFPFAKESLVKEIGVGQTPAVYSLLMICFAGLMGVVATGDAFNVFVFLEISSLSTYALVAMGARSDRRALTAAFTYLVLGTIGATFFVIGLGLLYQATGTLNMLDLHERLAGQDNRVVRAGFAFIITGIGLKLAMFPIHRWLPDAYAYAPSAVTAFLAATATKVAVYLMLRFLFTVFGFSFAFLEVALVLFLILGLAGMFIASLIAIFRDDVKQMLAFSSVAQIGYMLLGISFAAPVSDLLGGGYSVEAGGVTAAIMHLFNHALMKAALFMAVGAVFFAIGSHHISAYKGLGKVMPFTAGCITIAGLSLIGVPFTAGFISKFLLVEAAFASTLAVPSLLIVALIMLSSLLAVAYIGRLAYEMFLADPPPGCAPARVPMTMLVPMGLMTAANIYVGIDAEGLTTIMRQAAMILLQPTYGLGGAL